MKEEGAELSPQKPAERFTHSVEEWCQPLCAFMEASRTPAELVEYLQELVGELDSPLSKYLRGIGELESDLPSEDPPEAAEPTNLLPVRMSSLKEYLKGKDQRISAWLVAVVEVLNYQATMGKMRTGPKVLNAAQELMVTRLERAVRRTLDKGGVVSPLKVSQAELGRVRFDYGGEPIHYMEDLVASKVIACWPKVGEAAVQDARAFVPDHVREWLDNPQGCLLPQSSWPETPPKSRVRASDEEWELIVEAAVARGMMRKVPEDELLRDASGVPVLNGAGAVKKIKRIGGEDQHLQRFISILVPSNSYQAHMPGDDVHLPYLGQMSMMEVDEDEEVLVDSEDLASCFNLFRLPPAWSGFAAFSKKVSARLFGGPASEQVYVGMSVVPMGWINSVALMQTVVRTLVFGLSQVPEETEVSKLKWFPEGDSVSVVYLDSFDELRKVKAGYRSVLEGAPSHRHQRFVNTCNELNLPLNEGKKIVGAVHGLLQGGDFDGTLGIFEASHDKKLNLLELGVALLGAGEATEFELRHFVGKAIFSMSFRRPLLAFLEQVFVDMGAAGAAKVQLSRRTLDEIYMVMVCLPLMHMNLRAQMDMEVSITDASTTGGGAAVATRFKQEPDTTRHDGNYCQVCGRALKSHHCYPCPAGCRVSLCSLDCIQEHRDEACKRRDYSIPKFGERFSGPNAPLSHAVARLGCVEVQPPYDLERGGDFFSEEGKNKLDRLEGDPDLVVEHWAPSCRLFSQARGKPVKLPDGRTIPGPQAVRDAAHVMGVPWVKNHMKGQLRQSNNMALRGLKRAKSTFGRRRFVTIEHPYNSWLWCFALAEELERDEFQYAIGSNCCWGGERVKWYALLNNSEEIHQAVHRPSCPGHDHLRGYEVSLNSDGSLRFATEEESEYKQAWCDAYAQGLKAQLVKLGWIEKALVAGRLKKIIKELQQSTQRLSDPAVALEVGREVAVLERGMQVGLERQHLREMARRTSIRGTDVRLLLGDNGLEAPYPAYRWLWHEVLAYAWREERHINEGEVGAFNVLLRRRAKDPSKHEMRYLNVVDSLVTRGAISKGRSPSRGMNRLLKQTAALLLASDQYPLIPWTISRWNFADGASRRRVTNDA